MKTFERSQWADSAFAREYLENADHCIPERRYLFHVLRSFYRAYVARTDRPVRVCDLGCGDGVLIEQLLAEDATLEATLVDGSTEMLTAARRRLSDRKNTRFVQQPFDAFGEAGPFDLVVSGFAIHHVEPGQRVALFRSIHRCLAPAGSFVNIEVALPESPSHLEWHYQLWRDWIAEHSRVHGLGESFQGVPAKARADPDNQYRPLGEQLADLRIAGFDEVECHYRNGIFAIYSGRRP